MNAELQSYRAYMKNNSTPIAIFDQVEYLKPIFPRYLSKFSRYKKDFNGALSFLLAYKDISTTYNAYRREIEKLLHWSWQIAEKSIYSLERTDIELYVKFCQRPPRKWIGLCQQPRFILAQGKRIPNPQWRPFVARVTKSEYQKGIRANSAKYEFSSNSTKELLAILSSFFNYLLMEKHIESNPVALIRQKSKFVRKHQGATKIRRLSKLQWQYVIEVARGLADTNPASHERTLFIMSILYAMYLRISELTATSRWTPLMNHFYRDNNGNWWFTTIGKGNKQRQVAVSDNMLIALKRWRKHLGLSQLPSLVENFPLLPKIRGKGAISHATGIRKIVQYCFNRAMDNLKAENHEEEADSLMEATVHWLRHTGISDDVKRRPREHVRDDAGHSSSITTDRYIDVEMKERHRSAKNKPL